MSDAQVGIDSEKSLLQDSNSSSTIITNRTIANYRLVELRGTGGMASIYKAIQLSLDRPVALKIMHPHLHNNETFVARFEKEAKRAAMLQHENIVSIIDYGCDNGEYYIAMEYIDGTNLGEIIKKQRKMPLEVAMHICHQVAEGLKYAHGTGLTHRDIKPANIMLSYDGRVMLTDFGIAKASGDLSITSTGQVIGSPSYMAPEQAAGRPTDHRSDLFSLGIIMYEIIAGRRPFVGETYQTLVSSIISDYPVSLLEYRVDANREIDDLVQKALVKVTDSRYQTAEEFSEAILAQLSKFKIPSTRKMMAEYLKSPIRVTEKLRADKISDHMESALYYLAVGEGKLAEAKKEFLDVLRFDKNNKEAKKHLARIESHLPPDKTREGRMRLQVNTPLQYAAAAILLVISIIAAFSFWPENEDRSADTRLEVLAPDRKVSKPNLVVDSQTGQLLSPSGEPTAQDRTGTTGTAGDRVSSVTTPTALRPSSKAPRYDYPRQNLLRYGTVYVRTDRPARIFVDAEEYGWTNGPSIKLPPGRHRIEVRADGFQAQAKRIFLRRGQADTLSYKLALEK